MTIYDISPAITSDLWVWPGDTPPSREIVLDLERGDDFTLSTLRATVHLGAHVDAPSHYGAGAPSIEQWSPERFLGRCQLIRVGVEPGATVTTQMLAGTIQAERVLLATDTFPGVALLGIDTPSVDLFAAKEPVVHRACLRNDVAILEGLVLHGVPAGLYELIAVPLKLVGFDASPVRALLREL
jgi:arylformamidase